MKLTHFNIKTLLSARELPVVSDLLRSPLQGLLLYGNNGYYPQDPYSGQHWHPSPSHEDWWGPPRRHRHYDDPDPGGFWQGFAFALLLVLAVGVFVTYHVLKS